MGLFSTVINSCSLLGEEFLGSLQTKELDEFFSYYWIDPAGRLFLIDYSESIEVVPIKSNDWLPCLENRKTGKHGRVTPVLIGRWIRLYNSTLETYVFFQYGKISGVTQSVDFHDAASYRVSSKFLDTTWELH